MQPFNQFSISVSNTPKMIFAFRPKEISSLLIKANGEMYIGVGGVSTTKGFYLANGDSWGINLLDLSEAVKAENDLIQVYAIATFATTASIMSIRS